MKKIASFCVNHDKLDRGMYISRTDGDVVTYDIRMKRPNGGDYLENGAMHTFEHLFATFARNGKKPAVTICRSERQFTRKQAQQCGFATAVATYNSYSAVCINFNINIRKHRCTRKVNRTVMHPNLHQFAPWYS